MNNLLPEIPHYLSKKISDLVKNDGSIVNLSIGEPFFAPPSKLFKSFQEIVFPAGVDISNVPIRYSDSRGDLCLREAISGWYRNIYNARVDSNTNILVTHGGAEAIWLTILTLTSINDEVIIPDPSYIMYENHVKLLGRIPIKIPTSASNGFCLTIKDIEANTTSKTKLILINSPENPTGAVYSRELIQTIVKFAESKKIYFAHDEVYDSFVFDGPHQNVFRLSERINNVCVLINSFSKKYSMMGWRLGWIIGSEEVVENATKIHTNMTLNLGSFHQKAAASILNNEETRSYLEGHTRDIVRNIKVLKSALSSSGAFEIAENTPKGAFFLFPNVSTLYKTLAGKYRKMGTVGECVANYLLEQHKIAVVPGIVYGKCGADFIRIAAAVEESVILEAAQRFENVLQYV